MLNLTANRKDIFNELSDIIKLFVPDFLCSDLAINFLYASDKNIQAFITINNQDYLYETPHFKCEDLMQFSRLDTRFCKHSLYKALKGHFKRDLPWGSLTGIRPTKLAYQMLSNGFKQRDIADEMENTFLVSKEKSKLVSDVICAQTNYVNQRMSMALNGNTDNTKLVNLYIHVPFCPSRCYYCSFVSTTAEKQKWLIAPYVEALIIEINHALEMVQRNGQSVFSIYVGGGTPTVLSAEQLYKVLKATNANGVEFTCEAGRPDTITREKLLVMNECGVNRISVNPQTLSDKTLQIIGRNHTSTEFFDAYKMAREVGMRINVDLIAGLKGEQHTDFVSSLNGVIKLKPENITVHTLCRKRGSELSENEREDNADVSDMVEYSVKALYTAGYIPYYLYRQKQMLGNLENIGWSLPRMLCVNNVTTMEETLPVLACGAGAISKTLHANNRIERLANVKDALLYLKQFEERLNKKQIFYENPLQ